MTDKQIGPVTGRISAKMAGILVSAVVALDLGPKTSMNVTMERDYYRDVLERIVNQATEAENMWREYMEGK